MISIKEISKKDIPLIREMALRAFPETYAKILTPEQIEYMLDMMYSEESLNKQFENGHAYFVGYIDEKPFGYLSVERENADTFHLQKLYLLKEYQGKKLGELLFNKAVKYVRENCGHKCRMILNVNRYNKALGFYQKMGMTKIDEGDFPIGNNFYMQDYIMCLEISR